MRMCPQAGVVFALGLSVLLVLKNVSQPVFSVHSRNTNDATGPLAVNSVAGPGATDGDDVRVVEIHVRAAAAVARRALALAGVCVCVWGG